jgi:hypothetical protein
MKDFFFISRVTRVLRVRKAQCGGDFCALLSTLVLGLDQDFNYLSTISLPSQIAQVAASLK